MLVLMLQHVSSRVSHRRVYGGSCKTFAFLKVSKQAAMSFCVAGVALPDILTCLQTRRELFCVQGAILLPRFQNMSCIFRGTSNTLETTIAILRGRRSTSDVLRCPLYTPHSTLYTFNSSLHTLPSTLYTLHLTLHTLHSTLYTLHSTFYAPYSTLYTPHSTLHTPHFTLIYIHSTFYTPHSTLHTLHFTLHTPHSTLYPVHSPLYTLHSTLHT